MALRRRTKIIIGSLIAAVVAFVVLALVAVIGVTVLITGGGDGGDDGGDDGGCGMPGIPIAVPPVAGSIQKQQMANAKIIAETVKKLDLGADALRVTLTAAMGESSMLVLDYGDSAGPDSRGLYQQRSTWGTEEQRMDPVYSTTSFLLGPKHDGKDHGPGGTGLVAIKGWQDMPISAAIHEVQINADPNHYTQFIAQAEAIAKKAGVDFDQFGDGDGGGSHPGCIGDDPGDIGTGECPLDGSAAPGKKNPADCDKALSFMIEQMTSGSTAWNRQCLALVMQAYGWAGGPATARDAAQIVIDAGKMHHDTSKIPRGAVLWWDGSATGNSAGHVAIADGKGYIYSNDVTGPGKVGRVPWTFPEKSWGQEFLGWSAPYFPTAV